MAGATEAPRALLVVHYFPPHIGGMEEVVRAQARSLVRRGHPVTVVTCAHRRGLARRCRQDGYEVRRVPALNFIERRFGVTFPLVSPMLLVTLIREARRADVVHLHDAFYLSSHLAFLACLLTRRPFFMTQHVAMVDHPSRLVTLVQKLVYATMGRAMFRRAAAVVTYNSRVRDFVVSRGAAADRVVMHHNGIDTDYFVPADRATKAELRARHGLPADRPVALFVGRLVPKKGARLVVEAAPAGVTTLVVGEGSDLPASVPPGVVLFGPAGREQLRDLYRLSDVFVFPAVSEMFTLVMQEAMASGLPVVTTDDPAYGHYDVDRELVRLVERDPAALSSAVQLIIGNPELAARMSAYSRELACQRFSWEANYPAEYGVYRLDSRLPAAHQAVEPAVPTKALCR